MATDILEQLRKEPGGEDLDLSWLDQPAAERGLRIAPGKRGLTLEDIATKSYGEIPSQTTNQSGRPCASTCTVCPTSIFQRMYQVQRPVTTSVSATRFMPPPRPHA